MTTVRKNDPAQLQRRLGTLYHVKEGNAIDNLGEPVTGVIEVWDGRLPEGISGKDITGPIVLMTDRKLPERQEK